MRFSVRRYGVESVAELPSASDVGCRFTLLDATTELSRPISQMGIYPAVDPLTSTSRILEPGIVGAEHFRVANEVKGTYPLTIRRTPLVASVNARVLASYV